MKINSLETIHIEAGCTLEECLSAVNLLYEKSGKPPNQKARVFLANVFYGMPERISAPFEVQLGPPDSAPFIIVHPKAGRIAGDAAKAQAVAQGKWETLDVTKDESVGPNKEKF